MQESDLQAIRQERDKWYQRACEFKRLALTAVREDDDDADWFERAYRHALQQHTLACCALEENAADLALAT